MLKRLRSLHESSATILLLLLLCADVVFITLHIIVMSPGPRSALCDVSGICANIEIYHLIKLFWVVVLFACVLGLTRQFGYVAWGLLFACLLLDDALHLHQGAGDRLASVATIRPWLEIGFRARAYQLAVLGMGGLLFLVVLAWAYVRGTHAFRKASADMLLFIAALVFFGLIVDVATAFRLGPSTMSALGIVEDGGELVVDSLIVWSTFRLAVGKGKHDTYLWDVLRGRP